MRAPSRCRRSGATDVVGAEAARRQLLAAVLGHGEDRRGRAARSRSGGQRQQPDRAGADHRHGVAGLHISARRRRAARRPAARPARRPRRPGRRGPGGAATRARPEPSLQPPPVSRQKPVCRPAPTEPVGDVAAQRGQALRRTPAHGGRRRAPGSRGPAARTTRRPRRGPAAISPTISWPGTNGVEVSDGQVQRGLAGEQRLVGAADAAQPRADGHPVRARRARRADVLERAARPRRQASPPGSAR